MSSIFVENVKSMTFFMLVLRCTTPQSPGTDIKRPKASVASDTLGQTTPQSPGALLFYDFLLF